MLHGLVHFVKLSGTGAGSPSGPMAFNPGTANAAVPRKITTYTVAGDVATFTFAGAAGAPDAPFPVTPAAGNPYQIIGHA
jgi:hypothetical protein